MPELKKDEDGITAGRTGVYLGVWRWIAAQVEDRVNHDGYPVRCRTVDQAVIKRIDFFFDGFAGRALQSTCVTEGMTERFSDDTGQ